MTNVVAFRVCKIAIIFAAQLAAQLGVLSCVFAQEPIAQAGATETKGAWFQRSLVGLEVGPTGSQFGGSIKDTGFAVRFNGADIARATKATGAEYLVIWAREGDWAFYDSKLQPKPPGLGSARCTARSGPMRVGNSGCRSSLTAKCNIQLMRFASIRTGEWWTKMASPLKAAFAFGRAIWIT